MSGDVNDIFEDVKIDYITRDVSFYFLKFLDKGLERFSYISVRFFSNRKFNKRLEQVYTVVIIFFE